MLKIIFMLLHSSFPQTYFTKYFPQPTALPLRASALPAAFHLTEAAKHIIFQFPGLSCPNYETPKQKKSTNTTQM